MTFAENNRISHRQLYRQLTLTFLAPFLLCLFHEHRLLGTMGILGTAAAVILLFFYVIFLIRLAPQFENLQKTCGTAVAWMIGTFFLIYTLLTNAYLVSVLMEIVPESLLEGVPKLWVGVLAAAVCSHGTYRGMQRRGRMAEVSGGMFLAVVLLMMLLSLGQAKVPYLKEMLIRSSRNLDSFWKNGYGVFCAFSGIGLLPFLLFHVEKNGSAWKPAFLGILTVGGILEGMLFLLPAVFGWDRLKAEEMPILPLLAGANLPGGILARFDVLWMGFVIYGLLYTSGSLFHYSHQIIQTAFGDVSDRNTCSDLMETQKHRRWRRLGQWRSAFLAVVVVILSVLKIRGAGIQEYFGVYLGVIFVPGMLLIQLLLLTRGRERRKKRIAMVSLGLLMLLVSGCAGIEPEERMYPLALAIWENGDGLNVCYGMPDLGKSTGQGKEEEGESISLLTFTGRNFEEIEKQYNASQEKYLDLGHLQVLILEQSMVKGDGWKRVLSYLTEERMLGENIYVFEAENPEDIMEWQKSSGTSVGEYLTGIMENDNYPEKQQGMTLRQVYHDWYANNQLPEPPLVNTDGEILEIERTSQYKMYHSCMPMIAWWGTLYPKFCFGEIKKEDLSHVRSDRPKISFYLAKLLDW